MQRKRDTPDRHQQQSNDGQDTYISNQSNDNASDNEFYFADEETKTETETTTKIDIDKTIKTKTTATPNADTTTAIKSAAEKMRHTRLTPTTKAMMDKTLIFRTKAMTTPLTMNLFCRQGNQDRNRDNNKDRH
jgi:hypothetical protein